MPITAAPYFLRPSVKVQEFDLTQRADAARGSIGCITAAFKKGPLRPTYVGGRVENFYRLYGNYSDPTLSFGHDTAVAFMGGSSTLLVNRVVNGALHAGIDVFLDNDNTYGKRMLMLPHKVGDEDGYEGGWAGPTLLKFDTAFVLANQFTMNVTDGTTVTAVSVTWNTDHRTTMYAIATAIQTAINGFGSGGSAYVYVEPSSATADPFTIVMVPPKDATVTFNTPATTLGVTQNTPSLINPADGWLMTVLAENPGEWANDMGVKITNVDPGVRERWKLTFSAALVTGNSFSLSINEAVTSPPISGNVGPVLFATNSDTTMAAIATAIKGHALIADAFVDTVDNGTDNDRVITIVANKPIKDHLSITEAQITGGATQASIVITKTLDGLESNGSFVVELFDRDTPTIPMERNHITTFPSLSGNGNQLKYDGIINGDGGSDNIRVVVNSGLITKTGFEPFLLKMLDPAFVFRDTVAWMAGGTDGSTPLTSHMVAALKNLTDRSKYPVSMMLNAGYTDITYQQSLVALCETRKDCTAILDMPTAYQKTGQVARDYRMEEMNLDSSYGAIYTPDVLIQDLTTNEKRYIPPSGLVGAAYAYNDRVAAPWAAPAGLNRGVLRRTLGLRYDYSPTDEELMFPNGVNAIIDKRGNGPTIMGEETLQVQLSALRSVHIRRLMNLLTTTITDGLDYTLFEPHTEFTRFQVVQMASDVLRPVHRADGLYGFRVVCDERNNTPEVIDADALALDIYVKPVRAIKGVLLRSIITKTGANFEEIITSFNS